VIRYLFSDTTLTDTDFSIFPMEPGLIFKLTRLLVKGSVCWWTRKPAVRPLPLILLAILCDPSGCPVSGMEVGRRLKVVYECDFQNRHDLNVDRQPDGWRRRRDRDHPAYITAQIVPRDAALSRQARQFQLLMARAIHSWKTGKWESDYMPESIPEFLVQIMDGTVVQNCYEVRMDGGAFELVSPRFPFDPRLSYRLHGQIACKNLLGHEARIELHVFDHSGEPREVFKTSPASGDQDWQDVQSKLIAIQESRSLVGEIRMVVEPRGNGHGLGFVRFDSIQLHQLPRLSLECDSKFHIVDLGKSATFTLSAIGLPPSIAAVDFKVLDVDDRVIAENQVPLTTVDHIEIQDNVAGSPAWARSNSARRRSGRASGQSKGWAVTLAQWKPELSQPGYYRLKAVLGGSIQQEVPVLVINSDGIQPGPFGWSLADTPPEVFGADFIEILQKTRPGWIKVPVWFDYRDRHSSEAILGLLTQLHSMDIQCVGVLNRPPETSDKLFGTESDKLHPVAVMSEPQVWQQAMEPILTQLGMKLKWLQLGDDEDRSLAKNLALREQLNEIQKKLRLIGQEFNLVVGWDWTAPVNSSSGAQTDQELAWKALCYSSPSPISSDEILKQVESAADPRWQIWSSIKPLPRSQNALRFRVTDLIEQMMTVREAGIPAAFVSRALDEESGMFSDGGLAGDLLFPWLQMISAIGTREFAGTMELPNGSSNRVFIGEGSSVVILWSNEPLVEQLFVGEQIDVRDIWGRSVDFQPVPLASGGMLHRIPVGKWPVIIRNADGNLIRWQQQFELLVDNLPSEISAQGMIPVQIVNTMSLPVEGTVDVISSSLIEGDSFQQDVSSPSGESRRYDLPFNFRPDASTGHHLLEFAFDIQNEQRHRFSIFKDVRLGHPDIELEWTVVRLNDQLVEVQVDLKNGLDSSVSFDCKLFPRNAAYQRFQILDAGTGKTSHVHRVIVPQQSVSEQSPIWVRCEQIGTDLVLNYRVFE
jgi:hypothetical protein